MLQAGLRARRAAEPSVVILCGDIDSDIDSDIVPTLRWRLLSPPARDTVVDLAGVNFSMRPDHPVAATAHLVAEQ